MKTRTFRGGWFSLCILITGLVTGRAASYDLAADYSTNSNPHGVWSYGWKATLAGNFVNFSHHAFLGIGQGQLLDYWGKSPESSPGTVFHNSGTQTVFSDGGQGVYPPGLVWFEYMQPLPSYRLSKGKR